jgi:hypothetical protein
MLILLAHNGFMKFLQVIYVRLDETLKKAVSSNPLIMPPKFRSVR